jgi:hypothetical protein
MSERFKTPSRVEQDRGACRANDFGQTNPSEIWPGRLGALDRSLASRLKNSLYFSCCLQGGLFSYPLQLHACARSQKAGPSKSGRFWRNEPDGHPNRTQMQTWPNEPTRFGGGQRAGRTSLGRDSARMVISAIIEGLRHNDFRHFPQTKPISANEANGEKPKETTFQDEQHAPGGRCAQEPADTGRSTDLILRRREAPSRRMAAGSVSLVAVLRDARKSALLRTRSIEASI